MNTEHPMIIIGAGIGGISAAATLRASGYSGPIVLINNEKEFPYDRPPLSKTILQGEESIPDIYLRSPTWYPDNSIEILNGVAVTRISSDAHQVSLSNGDTLSYKKLLLATGAEARSISALESATIPHFYLRTAEDAMGLKDYMKPGKRLILVGAGVIGLEVAASAVKCGCDVSVLEIADRVMARSMPPIMSTWLQEKHQSRGIKFYMPDSIAEFANRDGNNGVILKSGTFLPADVMLICAGVIPATQLAEEAGLTCDNGIVVNEFAETSATDIYAIGDVANYPDTWTKTTQRAENWMHAQRHAECAAANMLASKDAEKKPYTEIQSVWSDQYEFKIQMAGILEGAQEIVRGDMASDQFMIFWLNNDIVTGVLAVNQAKNMRPAQNLIKNKSKVDVALMADDTVNLKKVAI